MAGKHEPVVRAAGGVAQQPSRLARQSSRAAPKSATRFAPSAAPHAPGRYDIQARAPVRAGAQHLLYYDRIGLLRPNQHSPAGYRIYDAQAIDRLKRIVELRSAGMALTTVKLVLETSTPLADALEQQVALLNRQLRATARAATRRSHPAAVPLGRRARPHDVEGILDAHVPLHRPLR